MTRTTAVPVSAGGSIALGFSTSAAGTSAARSSSFSFGRFGETAIPGPGLDRVSGPTELTLCRRGSTGIGGGTAPDFSLRLGSAAVATTWPWLSLSFVASKRSSAVARSTSVGAVALAVGEDEATVCSEGSLSPVPAGLPCLGSAGILTPTPPSLPLSGTRV